jgi:hypothetical protein
MTIFSAPSFYNLRDRNIYDQGFYFQPQEMFSDGPFNPNQFNTTGTGGGAAATGIETVLNQGGGGGAAFTGGIGDLTTAFQKAVDDRQARFAEYNMPFREGKVMYPGQTGDSILMERLAPVGAPADFYEGSIEGIPQIIKGAPGIFEPRTPIGGAITQSLNRAVQRITGTPQTAEQIMEEGYNPQTKLGFIANLLPDKFGTLPRPDQAFIQKNMGYTGPTVFGENTSGGNKDPFGLNVRSGFGNYAEAVEREFNRVNDYFNSDKFANKYGADTKLELDEETGLYSFVGKNAARANQMNKMNLARYNYYNEKVKERDAFRAQEKARIEADKARTRQIQQQLDAGTFGRDDPPDRSPGSVTKESAAKTSGVGGGGYTKSDSVRESYRGRYMMGGLADLVDIYD